MNDNPKSTMGQSERAGVSIDIAEEQATPDQKSKWAPFRVHTRSKESVADSEPAPIQPCKADTTWKTSYFRWGPSSDWCLLFVFLSIPAAAAVLGFSNHCPVESWTVKPSVYLAVMTGVGNKALAFAAFQGGVITWWLRALKGTTVRSLHRDWAVENGSNLWALLTAGVTAGNVGISALCASIIFVDGILLQLSTTTAQMSLQQKELLQVNIYTEMPTNFTGSFTSLDFSDNYIFLPVYRGFVDGSPIPAAVSGCSGVCTTEVAAAAVFQVGHDCDIFTSDSGYVNLTALQENWTNNTRKGFPSFCHHIPTRVHSTCPLLDIDIGILDTAVPFEGLQVWIGLTDEDFARTSARNYTARCCVFRAAVGRYPVTVYGNATMSVDFAKAEFLSWANNTGIDESSADHARNSTLVGIMELARTVVQASCSIDMNSDYDQPLHFAAKLNTNPLGNLNIPIWADPLPNITATLNEAIFGTSVYVGQLHRGGDDSLIIDPGANTTSEVVGTRIDTQPVFVTHWRFFAGAAIFQLVCVGLVGNTFWGYWKLGRSMSLSPLEIAKAFDAPLLRDVP